MRKFYKTSTIVLILTLCGTIVFSILYSKNIYLSFLGEKERILNHQKVPVYHFYVILRGSEEPYLKGMIKGIKETADSYKAALEINYISGVDDYQETLKLFNIALSSRVEGIITHAYNTPAFAKLMEEADKRKIPVVTLEEGMPQSKSSAYVGSNGFEIGAKAGKLVAEARSGNAKVILILEDIKNYGNIKVEGFKDAIKEYNSIKIETIKVSDLGIVGANTVTAEILYNYPNVNTIVCTSSKDTIGAAQLVVDLNKVGEITIIGYDITPEITKYIENGVIYGTVVPNAYLIGSNSIRLLADLKEKGRASTFLDTGINVITNENIDLYLKNNPFEGGHAKQ